MVFHGLIAYPLTPFTADGSINAAELSRSISALAASGVDGIAVLGSSGSFAYLDRAERAAVVRAAVEAAAGTGVPVSAGISAVGTREVLQHAADAAEAGASGLVLSTVSYVPLTRDEVSAQCRTVAGEFNLPLCLYNNPGTTQFAFELDLVAELSEVDNIVAFKDSAPDAESFRARWDYLGNLTPDGFSHGLSGDLRIVEDDFAADAWHSGPAALLPAAYLRLRAAVQNGDRAALAEVKSTLVPLIHELAAQRKLSSLHSLARACGIQAGDPRAPLLPVPGSGQRELARLVDLVED